MNDATRWNSGKTTLTSLLLSSMYCHTLILKIFSFPRRFWNRFRYTVLMLIISMMPENRSKFSRFPENHWVVSFIVYAFHTTTFFQLRVYIQGELFLFYAPNSSHYNLRTLLVLSDYYYDKGRQFPTKIQISCLPSFSVVLLNPTRYTTKLVKKFLPSKTVQVVLR